MGNRGDILYIPSSVTIFQNTEESSVPRRYEKLSKPMNVLCVGSTPEGYKKIVYRSEIWLVSKSEVYLAKKEII